MVNNLHVHVLLVTYHLRAYIAMRLKQVPNSLFRLNGFDVLSLVLMFYAYPVFRLPVVYCVACL